jgi:YHS domain-containing protein
MLKRIIGLFAIALFVSFVTSSVLFAESTAKTSGSSFAVKVNNEICPVTGDKVDMKNPVTVEYKGKIYNLCCPMCVDTFNKSPEQFAAKAEGKK